MAAMDFDVRASPASEAEPWSREPPAGSQHHHNRSLDLRQTPKHRNPNRVKAKPANPNVISSILSSLEDTLTELPVVERSEQQSDTASKHSRPESSTRSVASSASIHRNTASPGFGVEYGNSLSLDDDEGVTDAALPPTIPTSRPPSGLSNYTAKRHSSFSKPTAAAAVFRNRPSSRRSSFSGASVDGRSSRRNKLSSESWVRQNKDSDGRSDISRGRTPRKSLRRVSSQEMLRSASREFSPQPSLDTPSVSLAEKIIARTPPPISTSKGRLYLTDVTINEDLPIESPISPTPIAPSPLIEQKPAIESKASSGSRLSVGDAPLSKTPSPISDSIPTRTSSLRQPSNSPAGGRKKHKKSKKLAITPSKAESMAVKESSPSIPDSSWIDLGEEDETVKRIKQLREKRKSRLQESTTYSSPIESPTDAKWPPVYELSAPPAEESKRGSRTRPVANRSATEPGFHQHLLGDRGEEMHEEHVNGASVNGTSGVRNVPATSQRSTNSLELTAPLSVNYRPATSKSDTSPIPPPSLDYSYARAVDLLNGIEYSDQEKRSRESSDQGSLFLKGLDLPTPQKQTTLAPPPHGKSAKKSKRSPSDRWTAVHPDLPLEFDKKKNRRKSMSDARLARALEDDEELRRKDSIEDAVEQYLNAPRLSHTIKHPATGRTIAFSEVGDPEGAAVFVCVGMGLTRYVTAFFDELATTLRLRLITLDRPGVGASEPFPPTDKSGPLSWPEDVLAVCQHLGIVKFSILAHSAGAIYALATALILPHLVKGKVHLLAPWVPPSQLEAISHTAASAPPSNPLPRSQRFLRVLPTPFLKAANSSFMTATSASLKPATKRNIKSNSTRTPPRRTAHPDEGAVKRPMSSDRPDRPEYNRRESMMLMDQFMPNTNPLDNFPIPVVEEEEDQSLKRGSLVLSATASPMDPGLAYATSGLNAAEHAERERQVEYTSRLTQRTWELATRDSNPATDLLVCLERNRDVGFRYTDVGREVVITHGSEDKRVPIANVKWLAEQMNRRALGLHFDDDARESRESWVDASARGGCEVRVLPGEGHGLMASPVIMGDVLTEIAGYWAGQHNGRL